MSDKVTIFDEQISRKPDRYPWAQQFIEAMQDGFWTHRKFNFKSDLHDYKINLTEQEREIIVKSLATIGQLEISVKKFWSKIGDNLPHPSINDLGYVMANVEVIHGNAYERLLEILGLENTFDEILKLDIIKGRVNYLRKHLHKFHQDNKKQFIYSLILFTLFVENIALFSQFYTIMFFGRYKNSLKDTNKQVEYTSREECFIEGTEVLTPSGWIDFRDIKIGDDVVQYTHTGNFEFTKVVHKTEKYYSGDIISFSRLGNLCSVTPNHDMVYFNKHGKFTKKQAKDLKTSTQKFIPISGNLSNNGIDELSFEDRLKIAIQADGSNLMWISKDGEKLHRGVSGGATHKISIKKQRKIERLDYILSNCNIKYIKKPRREGFEYIMYFNNDYDYKKFDWVQLKDKSSVWCEEFIKEASNWDGYKIPDSENLGYSTTKKDCLDKIQLIAIMAGFATNFYPNTKAGYTNPCYKILMRKVEKQPMSHSVKKVTSQYSGNVYCVSVPSGAIMTRLNGKTFIAGNCLHAEVGIALINTIRQEIPELFDDELQEKILYETGQAVKYECEIVDWIIDGYYHEKLNAPLLKEFIKNRMNESLTKIGYSKIFDVDKNEVQKTDWFDEQILGNNHTDFFAAHPVEYSINNKSFNEEDLF